MRTRIAPACRQTASKTSIEPASDPVWERAARAPSSVIPPLSTIVGLTRASAFNASKKARPSRGPSM